MSGLRPMSCVSPCSTSQPDGMSIETIGTDVFRNVLSSESNGGRIPEPMAKLNPG